MPDASWTTEPIYKPIVYATDALKADGYTDDRIIDALLSVALTWGQHRHGSRCLSQRLWILAQRFGAEADAVEKIAAEGANGSVH
jgi:hypothetical protein